LFHHHFVNDIRKGLGCLCCLICLGPVLFVIGISVLLSAPFNNSRENNLKEINADINLWTTTYETQFQQLSWTVYGPNGAQSIQATSPSYTSEMPDNDGVNSYTPYYFVTTAGNFISPTYYTNVTQNLNVKYSVTNTLTGASNNFTYSFQLFITNSSYSPNNNNNNGQSAATTCINGGGNYVYSTHTCYYYNQLNGICVKVDNITGQWSPDTTFGGVGCKYNGYSTNWNPASYQQLFYNGGAIFQQPLSFPSFSIMIRDTHDPYVQAQEITQGSMSFGLTKAQTAALGLGIMIVGIVFMVPCCIFGALFVFACSRRRGYTRY